MKIGKDSVVSIVYTLKYDNKEGEVIEKIEKNDPMIVIIGHEVLLEKFEENILGLSPSDKFDFILQKEDAYGEFYDESVVNVPYAELLDGAPKEMKEMIVEGNIVPINTDGDECEALVLNIKNEIVTLDFNHPLSGENLYFEGEVLSVRKAKAEELENVDDFMI